MRIRITQYRSSIMIKINLKVFIFALLSLTIPSISNATKAVPETLKKVPVGAWGIKIDNVDKIALSCREYRGNVSCEMFWVFSSFRVSTKIEDGNLKIYTDKDAKDHISVSLKNGRPYKFLQSGILTAKYFPDYSPLEFKSFKDPGMGSYYDITSSQKKNSAYNLYYERGMLKELPATLPAWLMNPAAYLFKNEKPGSYIGLNRVLQHPNLSADTLQDMYLLFNKKDNSYPSQLVVIARNPSTSKAMLEKLFNTDVSVRLHAAIWNAASANPNAPSNYKTIFYNRIITGAQKTHQSLLNDSSAPPELLDWIAKNGKFSYSRGSLYRHKNMWPETLDYLFDNRSNDEDKRTIASNVNTSDKTLLKLANVELKSEHEQNFILSEIVRKKGKGKEAAKIALFRLAHSKGTSFRSLVAIDARITKELTGLLIKYEAVSVRKDLATNKVLSYDDLVILSKDEYASVSKAARKQLKIRFEKQYPLLSATLPPLSSLNQALSLSSDLKQYVISGNVASAKKTINKLKRTDQPIYVNIAPALKNGDKKMLRLILKSGEYKFGNLVRKKEFNIEWLVYFIGIDAIKPHDQFTVLSLCFRAKRLDYAQVFLDHGYDINAPSKRKGENHLNVAIFMRDRELLDFLLDHKINIESINPRSRKSPVNLAKRLNFIYALERLDKEGVYANDVAEFRKKNTPNNNSPLIGEWSNLKGEFKTSNLSFNNDGSGKMLGAVGGFIIIWRELENNILSITPNINGSNDESKEFSFNYKVEGGRLTLKPDNAKSIVYYRVDNRTVSELLRKGDHHIDKRFIGTWSNDEKKYTLKINADGTAIYNKKINFVWKKSPNNSLTAYGVDGDRLRLNTQFTLSLPEAKEVLTVSVRGRSSEFKRVASE